ncbi:MAG: transcription antitermination factor NusB [Candidatus Nanopelagicales bacterium]|jgi:N utilization substance protein B|nr:transcription antitermination factor NusB [Candidatus Nanopelagicales bacterium]
MSARGKARKRALDIIFEAESKDVPIAMILGEHVRRRESDGDPDLNPYAVELVRLVASFQEQIDVEITTNSQGWTLERMPDVDRAILRLSVAELMFMTDTPHAVVVSQAVELAQNLSTDESGSFVHGVLGAVSRSLDAARTAG